MADEAARTLYGRHRASAAQNNTPTTPRRNRENRGSASTVTPRRGPRREIAAPSPPPIEYSYGVSPISSEIEELEFPVDVLRGEITTTIYKSPQKIERERKMREEVIVISDDDKPAAPSPTRPRPRKKRRLAKEPKGPVEVILIDSSGDETPKRRPPNPMPPPNAEVQEMNVDVEESIAPVIPFEKPANRVVQAHEPVVAHEPGVAHEPVVTHELAVALELAVHPWSRLTPETDETRLALEREFDQALAALTVSEPPLTTNPRASSGVPASDEHDSPTVHPPCPTVPHRPMVIVRRCIRPRRGACRGRGALTMRRITTLKPPRKKTTVVQLASPNPKPVLDGKEPPVVRDNQEAASAPGSAHSFMFSSSYFKTCEMVARAKGVGVLEKFREYSRAGTAAERAGPKQGEGQGAFANGYTPPESPTSDVAVTPMVLCFTDPIPWGPLKQKLGGR
ncbi:hypothetical protein FB45DRAFT_294023 [Roridomyces roridus]|uniref:Uncharacterized protein n=1 Tax=Roridomyces roridus TaxID=1738132 RepID=A0AAD7CBN0_9AGAR|nr:hypothetical protein FB45DRAFT_294023 [Roridomyces roridus]